MLTPPMSMVRTFVLASVAGAVAVLGLTLVIYGSFFQDFLERFNDLSPHVMDLITRDNPNFATILLANLAHGVLITTVIWWGRFHAPLRGAGAGAVVAFLTEIYFLFTQYSIFKTMSAPSAIFDTVMWTLINAVVGALVAWVLARGASKTDQIGTSLHHHEGV